MAARRWRALDAGDGLPLSDPPLCAREEDAPEREAAPQEEIVVDLASQDRRISGKVVAPALVQAVATLLLAAVEGPQDGATLGMAVATVLTAAVGWVRADCRYVTLRQQLVPLSTNVGEGQLDQPD